MSSTWSPAHTAFPVNDAYFQDFGIFSCKHIQSNINSELKSFLSLTFHWRNLKTGLRPTRTLPCLAVKAQNLSLKHFHSSFRPSYTEFWRWNHWYYEVWENHPLTRSLARERVSRCAISIHTHTLMTRNGHLCNARTTPTLTWRETAHVESTQRARIYWAAPHTHTHTLAPIFAALANPYTAHTLQLPHTTKNFLRILKIHFLSLLFSDRIYCHQTRRKARERMQDWSRQGEDV